jgi:hypothetical protein
MKNRYAVVVAFGLLALASCGGMESTSTESTGTERSGQSTKTNNDGTALSVTCHVVGCSGTNAVLACTVDSTAATDAAAITLAGYGATAQVLTTIRPQDFTRWGPRDPHATATVKVTVPVPNGTYTLTICATQEGANGRLSKSACTLPVTIACYT